MASGRAVAGALIGLTIVAVFVGPLASVTGQNTGDVEFNQTVTASNSSYEDITGVYDITANHTVENDSGGTLSEGSDYELNQTAGTIKIISSSANVNDGETLRVYGEYSATSGTTTTIATLVPLFAALLILGTIAVRIQRMM